MSMNFDDVELLTNNKCANCGDKLTLAEIENGTMCLLCEIENCEC